MDFIVHPNAVGQVGRISLAGFIEVIDFLVGLRMAGEALLLISSGLAFADSSTARRFDLMPAGSAGTEVTCPVRTMGMDGHTFRLVGKVRAIGGGTATLTVLANTTITTRSVTLEATSEWQTIHMPFLAVLRDSNTVTLQFTGAGVEWSDLHAYPV